MKAIALGYDKDIAKKNSEVTRRLQEYTKRMKGDIYEVIHTWKGSKPISHGKVHFFPTNSSSAVSYPFDSYRIAKKVIKKYKPDLLACQDAHINGLVAVFLKKATGIKLCMHFHADFLDNPYWLREHPLHRLFNFVSYFTIKRADGFRVVSTKIKRTLVKKGIKPNKIHVVSTPINLEHLTKKNAKDIAALKEKHKLTAKYHLLFDGRLVYQKNLFMLLDAFKKLNRTDTHLLLAGEGAYEKKLKAYAKKHKIRGVRFIGRLEGDQLRAAYHFSDIVVIPSYYEGTAKTLKKACATGTACVTTDVSGTRDVIDNTTGIIVPIDKTNAFTKGMSTLLNDAALRKKLGKAAQKKILGTMTQKENMDEVIKVWKTVAGK